MSAAARSVHLWWAKPQNPSIEIKGEVVVDETVPGSYFCTAAFDGGYMGIQELVSHQGREVPKIVIFSVWDSNLGQCKLVESGPNVVSRRFGGEGAGYQSLLTYDWKIGEVQSCMVQATLNGSVTRYKGLFKGSSGDWMHIATYEVPVGGRLLQGMYSFIEDFLRNGLSQKQTRRARYALECRSNDQIPKKICQATFSADNTPVNNIDAFVQGSWIGLATGGNVVQTVPLGTVLQCQ